MPRGLIARTQGRGFDRVEGEGSIAKLQPGLPLDRNHFAGLQSLPAGTIIAICDPYGGAIARVGADQTAFAHRDALYCIQYYTSWESEKTTPERLDQMRTLHASMRPFVSGAAYVNYCDLELANWPLAYWGANLSRLSGIKATFDPDNHFHHAQSVPLSAAP